MGGLKWSVGMGATAHLSDSFGYSPCANTLSRQLSKIAAGAINGEF